PRNPIALCHGLFGFDTLGPQLIPDLQIHYWRGIPEALQQLGARVFVTKVSSIGSIHDRALALDKVLQGTLDKGKEQVNLIGHSMGGLDARYLVAHIQPQHYRVASVTTVGTPHHGSTFMDFCRDYTGLGSSVLRWHGFWKYAKSCLDYPAYSNLTTDYLRDHFNPNTPDNPAVQYFSYAGDPERMSIFSPLRGPWEVIRAREGPNDGLVSVKSAQWGQLVETVPANHLDL
ncbi:alpha/beta-hydrolase, partial [Basidiobolus meristosporus CBS 931.73]